MSGAILTAEALTKIEARHLTYDWLGNADMPMLLAELPDRGVASIVRMLMRSDLNHELVCVAARDRIMGLSKAVNALLASHKAQATEINRLTHERKRAPVQGFSAGIPWEMHLRAYDSYCKKYGKQQALIEGGCRGGFGTGELDIFIPGWRDELSTIGALTARAKAAEAKIAALENAIKAHLCANYGDGYPREGDQQADRNLYGALGAKP